MTKKGFTLIELLVVLGLIAVLAAILITVINPTKIFRKARDSQRSGDLRNLDQALTAYIVEKSQTGSIYLSGTSSNSQCVGGSPSTTIFSSVGINGTTNLSPFNWVQGTTSTAINGTGWIPIDFSSVSTLQLAKLPIDPLNTVSSPAYYYTYACKIPDFTYELNARLEAGVTDQDGGNNPVLYEVGPDKTILPASTGTNFYQNW